MSKIILVHSPEERKNLLEMKEALNIKDINRVIFIDEASDLPEKDLACIMSQLKANYSLTK
jgi:hypothetical protein